jgi:hypothetical protein
MPIKSIMMKSIPALVACCFLTVTLTAQSIPGKQYPGFRFENKNRESGLHRQPEPDSLLSAMYNQRYQGKPAPVQKSKSIIRQKMDSLHVQRFDNQIEALTTLNRDRFAYDTEGRLILAVSYTRNTWDNQYHWYKDTLSFDAKGNQTLVINYTRELETDPWTLENKSETWYDATGKDTL